MFRWFSNNNNTEIPLGKLNWWQGSREGAHGPSIQASALPTPGGAVYLRSPQLTLPGIHSTQAWGTREQRTKDLNTGKRKQLFKTWKCARSLVIRSVQRKSAKIILHLSDRQRLNYRHTLIPRWSDCIFPTAGQHTFSHKYVPCCWFKTCPRIYTYRGAWKLEKGHRNKVEFSFNAEWHVSLWSRQDP